MSNIGRNDPCPCGSGKKFKKCCGASGVVISMTGMRTLVEGRAADIVLAYVGFMIPRLLEDIGRQLGVNG